MENNENTYHGIPGTRFIWHGEWSDPEVEYQGKLYNGNSLEDTLWSIYCTECKENGNEPSEEEYDNLPTNWFTDNFLDIIMEDMNESKNVKKSIIKLNEERLRKVVVESVKRVLKEVYMGNGGDLMGMYDGEEGSTNEPDYEETDNNKEYALQIDLVHTYLQKAINCLNKAFAYKSQPSENALKAKKAIEVADNAIGNIIYNNFKS